MAKAIEKVDRMRRTERRSPASVLKRLAINFSPGSAQGAASRTRRARSWRTTQRNKCTRRIKKDMRTDNATLWAIA